jgi:hypothetical protein
MYINQNITFKKKAQKVTQNMAKTKTLWNKVDLNTNTAIIALNVNGLTI